MSTVRLKKDYDGHKAKSLISLPFGKARTLIAEGFAELEQPSPVPVPRAAATPAAADLHAAEIVRLNAAHKNALAEVRAEADAAMKKQGEDHAAAIDSLTAELAAAKQTITELQAKLGGGNK